jgi:hypothetical protein
MSSTTATKLTENDVCSMVSQSVSMEGMDSTWFADMRASTATKTNPHPFISKCLCHHTISFTTTTTITSKKTKGIDRQSCKDNVEKGGESGLRIGLVFGGRGRVQG